MLEPFVHRFVVPLLGGGEVHVGRPFKPREVEQMQLELTSALGTSLQFLRLRRAELLTPEPDLADPDSEELALWAGLHNALCFDHPDRQRVWTRPATWRKLEGTTRTLLTLPMPRELADGLARHVSVEAFLELRRRDTVVGGAGAEIRYIGQSIPRRRFALAAAPLLPTREETVLWIGQPHAPEVHRLFEDAMRASPLTCLLRPLLAPPGWSPLAASAFLQARGFARAICHRWATERDWISLGAAVVSALMPSVPRRRDVPAPEAARARAAEGPRALPGAVLPSTPADVAAVVGALVHLHFLKVLELDARLGVALSSRDPGVLWFLALPLLLPSLGEVLGSPVSLAGTPRGKTMEMFEAGAERRWIEYVDHLRELVPRSIVENLLASLVPAIVGTS